MSKQINCIILTVAQQTIIGLILCISNATNASPVQYFVDDSSFCFKEGSTFEYQFELPANGYYELKRYFYLGIAKLEMDKNAKTIFKTIHYDNDSLIIEADILHNNSIIYSNISKASCVLNGGGFSLFRIHTSKKIPKKTKLDLRIKIIRMDCKFPYNDTKLYLYLQRANAMR